MKYKVGFLIDNEEVKSAVCSSEEAAMKVLTDYKNEARRRIATDSENYYYATAINNTAFFFVNLQDIAAPAFGGYIEAADEAAEGDSNDDERR